MTIPAYSDITLSPLTVATGPPLTFNTDPVVTERWNPRKFTEPGLELAMTTIDEGRTVKDRYLTLTWNGGNSGQLLDKESVRQLKEWEGAQGATFRYQDEIEDDDVTVEILKVDKQRDAAPGLYRCVVELHCLAMATYLDAAYFGS